MKLKLSALLSLTTLTLASPLIKRSPIPPSLFLGIAKLGLFDSSDHYIGCATSVGQWTTDESKCIDFHGTYPSSQYTIATTAGDTCGTASLSTPTGEFWNCDDRGARAFWVRADAASGEEEGDRKLSDRPVRLWDYYRDRDDAPHWQPGPWCCIAA